MSTSTTTTPTRAIGPVGDWRHRAACRDVDPELFHPAGVAGPVVDAQVAQAKAVCARCLVRAECLAWALRALPFGVAGGMTEQERGRTRAHRGRAAPGGTAEGNRGGNRVPLLISAAPNPLAGTRALEGI